MTELQTFTKEYEGLVNALVTECKICEAFNLHMQPKHKHPTFITFNAIWDTGATNSVISKNVVQKLGLKYTGKTKINHAGGEAIVYTCSVNVALPNDVCFHSLKVTEADLESIDVLIGMDIISRCDFTVTASKGKTKFSFQLPSTHDTDYEKEYHQKLHTPVSVDKKQERNGPCACGSGKKYKQCCGKI